MKEKLMEILSQLEEIGDELECIEGESENIDLSYDISMACSALVDARVELRTAIKILD